jgi:hypothetical protein
MTVADELSRRLVLWEQISLGDAADIEPTTLHSMRMYGGAQGIWVDKKTTAPLSADGQGVTVSILHTGRHYPDDLSEDGLIYHYQLRIDPLPETPPKFRRPRTLPRSRCPSS